MSKKSNPGQSNNLLNFFVQKEKKTTKIVRNITFIFCVSSLYLLDSNLKNKKSTALPENATHEINNGKPDSELAIAERKLFIYTDSSTI